MTTTRAILVTALLLAGCDGDEPPRPKRKAATATATPPTLPLSQVEFLKAVRAKLGDALANGAEVGCRRYSDAAIVLKVVYPPSERRIGPDVGEIDARMVAGAAVKVLMERGWNPRERVTVITVAARQAAPDSPTDGEQVFKAGAATYDPVSDRVTFDPDE